MKKSFLTHTKISDTLNSYWPFTSSMALKTNQALTRESESYWHNHKHLNDTWKLQKVTDLGSCCPPGGILQKSGLDRTKGTPTVDCPEGLEWPGGDPVYNSGAGKAEWSLGPLVKGLE